MIMKNTAGFTLVEVLIAMAITMVIMAGAYTVFNSQQRTTTVQTNVSDAQQSLRTAMDFISRDIRMAGFDPEISGDFGIEDISFRGLDDNPAANGNSYMRFSWDKNEDGVRAANDADNEVIEYLLLDKGDGPQLFLRFDQDAANEEEVLASNIIAFGLAYAIDVNQDGELDQSGGSTMWVIDAGNDSDWDSLVVDQAAGTAVITETGIPLNRKDIRAVRIWLLARSEASDPNYTDSNTNVVGPTIVNPNDHFHHRMAERTVLCRNMGLNL